MCMGRWTPVVLVSMAFWLSAGGALAQDDVTGDGQEYERAKEHLKRGEFKAAIDLANEILQRTPNSVEAQHIRAFACYYSSGDRAKFAADLDAVLRLDPKHFSANCNRSGVHLLEGDQDTAMECAERAIRAAPDGPGGYECRGKVRFAKREYLKAIDDATKAIERQPDSVQAYLLRGAARFNLTLFEEAVCDFDEAVKHNPAKPECYVQRAQALAKLGELERAVADYTKALELTPNRLEYYTRRGLEYRNLRQLEKALEDFEKAISLRDDPRRSGSGRDGVYLGKRVNWLALAYAGRAAVKLKREDYSAVIEDCARALDLDPRCQAALVYRGIAHYSRREAEQVIEDCTRALDLDPRCGVALFCRGVAHYNRRELDQAIEDLSRTIEVGSDNVADAYRVRSRAFAAKGMEDEARADLKKAVQIVRRGESGTNSKEGSKRF